MLKYYIYKLFVKIINTGENLFVSGNSKKSAEIIDCLREYRVNNMHFNWEDKGGYNLIINYDQSISFEQVIIREKTIYLLIGGDSHEKDVVYSILSGYYAARRKIDGDYSNILCL